MIELTDENFEKEIMNANSSKPILVDFFATWCAPCTVIGPILEKISKDFEEKFIFAKANLDNIPEAGKKFGIDRVPTVIIFEKGIPKSGFVGLQSEKTIKEWLENIFEKNSKNLFKEYEDYAISRGFKLNHNREIAEKIIKGLLENEKKYGARYCPCRRITGNKEEDSKNICPCIYHIEELEKNGHCPCQLFEKGVVDNPR